MSNIQFACDWNCGGCGKSLKMCDSKNPQFLIPDAINYVPLPRHNNIVFNN
jgi:hypothetical protein